MHHFHQLECAIESIIQIAENVSPRPLTLHDNESIAGLVKSSDNNPTVGHVPHPFGGCMGVTTSPRENYLGEQSVTIALKREPHVERVAGYIGIQI